MKFYLLLTIFFTLNIFAYAHDDLVLSIPFDFKDNNLKIKVMVAERKFNVIFDTGAHGFELDSQFVKQIVSNKRLIDLNIHGLSFKNKFVRFRDWNKYISDEYDGIIGPDIFQPFHIEIDYNAQKINLYEQQHEPDSSYKSLKMRHIKDDINYYNFLAVPISISFNQANSESGEFLFDTGSSRNLTIFKKELSNEVGIAQKRLNASPHGFNNSINVKSKKVVIQNEIILNGWIDFIESLNSKYSGIAGNGILKYFNYYLNYEKSEFYFKKNQDVFDNRLISDGIIIRDFTSSGKGLRVVSTFDDIGKGKTKNLQHNDEVISIKYQNEIISFEEYKKLRKSIGTQFTFEVKRKKKIYFVSSEVKIWD